MDGGDSKILGDESSKTKIGFELMLPAEMVSQFYKLKVQLGVAENDDVIRWLMDQAKADKKIRINNCLLIQEKDDKTKKRKLAEVEQDEEDESDDHDI